MLSDDSELTELSSLEDNNAKSTTTNTKKSTSGKRKKEGYRLRNVLKPGRTTQYTAKALYDQIHQNDIDLDPDYQRDVVWSDTKQIGLIDSIFRNFYVPPIIFSVTTEDDGTEKRVCIDGKQRLTSIQKFIGGLIPHRDPFTNEKLWFVDSQSGPKRKLLPPQYKTLFQNKQIVCIEYSDLPGDLEREVFQRVQMGMALTTAEKLQAISGPWPDFVREIMRKYHAGKDGIASNMDLEQSRARDFQNVAQTLFCIDNLPDHVQGTPLQIERWLQQEDGPSDLTQAKIHDTFKIYKDLANHKQLKAPFKKPARVAPAEFIMTAVLIAVHKDILSLPQLSQAIGILRAKTRAEHVDVRTNRKVYKTMFHVIFKEIKASTVRETPGQEAAGAKSTTSSSITASKRKREESSGEESEDGDLGDDNAEYQPRSSKKRDPPPHLVNMPRPHLQKNISSMTSQIKAEDNGPKLSAPVPHFVPKEAQFSSSGIDKIRAAKLQVAEIFNRNPSTPLPSTSSAPNVTPSSLPVRPLPLPPPPNASLEAVMMSQSSNPPYAIPPFTPAAPMNMVNGMRSASGSISIPADGQTYPQIPPDISRTGNTLNDRGHVPRTLREEANDGGYRGRSGYDDRRDHDPDRTQRDRDRDRDRDWDRGRDREREISRDIPHSRGSYSGRGEPYYKSRDKGWSQRGSGYKDR